MFGSEARRRGSGGFQIKHACYFNGSNKSMWWIPSAAGNTKKWTFSCWIKKTQDNTSGAEAVFNARSDNNNYNQFRFNFNYPTYEHYAGSQVANYYRGPQTDFSDWYHYVVAYDSDNGAGRYRCKIYINGKFISEWTTTAALSLDSIINSGAEHSIGNRSVQNLEYTEMYLAEVNFIDGQVLGPEEFGEYNEFWPTLWQPKKVSSGLLAGGNSFRLDFADSANMGNDTSGNGNHWNPLNIYASDQVTDTPTNNACLWNLVCYPGQALSWGNRTRQRGTTLDVSTFGTMYVSSGKWYWEVKAVTVGLGMQIGMVNDEADPGDYTGTVGWSLENDGTKWAMGVQTGGSVGFAAGDIVGLVFDADAGDLEMFVNDISAGYIVQGLPSGRYTPSTNDDQSTDQAVLQVNPEAMTYPLPDGCNPLQASYLNSLPQVAIEQYFTPFIYTGDNVNGRVMSTVNQPDLVILKRRDVANSWCTYDVDRGPNKEIYFDLPTDEQTVTDALLSFDTLGFTLGAGSRVNKIDGEYLCMPFTKLAGVFDIVLHTGTGVTHSIPHNLGVKPAMMITKNLERSIDSWPVYIDKLGINSFLTLDANYSAGASSNSDLWNNTEPDQYEFTVGTGSNTNRTGQDMVTYLFGDMPGHCKTFKFIGTGNADGPYIELGFRPALVIIKRSSGSRSWSEVDRARSENNPTGDQFYIDTNAIEGSVSRHDLLASGFKIRSNNGDVNTSGSIYVGIAFAEDPFGMRGHNP